MPNIIPPASIDLNPLTLVIRDLNSSFSKVEIYKRLSAAYDFNLGLDKNYNNEIWTPLMEACHNENVDAVEWLITKKKGIWGFRENAFIDFNLRYRYVTALSIAVSRKTYSDIGHGLIYELTKPKKIIDLIAKEMDERNFSQEDALRHAINSSNHYFIGKCINSDVYWRRFTSSLDQTLNHLPFWIIDEWMKKRPASLNLSIHLPGYLASLNIDFLEDFLAHPLLLTSEGGKYVIDNFSILLRQPGITKPLTLLIKFLRRFPNQLSVKFLEIALNLLDHESQNAPYVEDALLQGGQCSYDESYLVEAIYQKNEGRITHLVERIKVPITADLIANVVGHFENEEIIASLLQKMTQAEKSRLKKTNFISLHNLPTRSIQVLTLLLQHHLYNFQSLNANLYTLDIQIEKFIYVYNVIFHPNNRKKPIDNNVIELAGHYYSQLDDDHKSIMSQLIIDHPSPEDALEVYILIKKRPLISIAETFSPVQEGEIREEEKENNEKEVSISSPGYISPVSSHFSFFEIEGERAEGVLISDAECLADISATLNYSSKISKALRTDLEAIIKKHTPAQHSKVELASPKI